VGLSECRDRIELAKICPVGAFVAKNIYPDPRNGNF